MVLDCEETWVPASLPYIQRHSNTLMGATKEQRFSAAFSIEVGATRPAGHKHIYSKDGPFLKSSGDFFHLQHTLRVNRQTEIKHLISDLCVYFSTAVFFFGLSNNKAIKLLKVSSESLSLVAQTQCFMHKLNTTCPGRVEDTAAYASLCVRVCVWVYTLATRVC